MGPVPLGPDLGERGLFMVIAESPEPPVVFDEAIVTAQRVLETIEFIDLVVE